MTVKLTAPATGQAVWLPYPFRLTLEPGQAIHVPKLYYFDIPPEVRALLKVEPQMETFAPPEPKPARKRSG